LKKYNPFQPSLKLREDIVGLKKEEINEKNIFNNIIGCTWGRFTF
jgi:hypothetical protein